MNFPYENRSPPGGTRQIDCKMQNLYRHLNKNTPGRRRGTLHMRNDHTKTGHFAAAPFGRACPDRGFGGRAASGISTSRI